MAVHESREIHAAGDSNLCLVVSYGNSDIAEVNAWLQITDGETDAAVASFPLNRDKAAELQMILGEIFGNPNLSPGVDLPITGDLLKKEW